MRVKILHNECQLNFRKWSLSLVLLSLLLTAIPMHAENNIPAERISIEEAFTLIGIEYGVHFNYDRAVVSDVEVDYESGQYEKVEDALQSVFSQTHLKYEIFDQRYVAVYRQDREGVESMKKMVSHFQQVINSSEEAYRRTERRITPPLASLSIKDIYSKRIVFSVSGTVTDQEGEPLIGVNIQVKGSNKGTSTDFDGEFTLEDIDENAILVISYVGYQTQEIPVAGKSRLEIVMSSDSQLLDEVVVVAYGTQRKANLTGSVASVDMKALESRPVSQLGQALQGTVPGLNLNVSGLGGELGQTLATNIRGTGTIGQGSSAAPLILIDGMEGNMNNLNPSDIESISVLKDASSAAVYGSRAAFGVILITTKSGKEGKMTVSYNNNFRHSGPTNLPNQLDSWRFANYFNDASANEGSAPIFNDETLERIQKYMAGEISTTTIPNGQQWHFHQQANDNVDWFKEHFTSSWSKEHNVQLNGGSEKLRYYFSSSYLDQDGILKHGDDNYKRFNTTAKINTKINDFIDFNVSTRFVRFKLDNPLYNDMNGLLYHDIVRIWPMMPFKDPNGHYMRNGKLIQMEDGGRAVTNNDNLYGQAELVFHPLENWNIYVQGGVRTINQNKHRFLNPLYEYDINGNPLALPYSGDYAAGASFAETFFDNSNFYTSSIYSDYTLFKGEHMLKGMLGMNTEEFKTRALGASRSDVISPLVPEIGAATGEDKITNSSLYDWATAGFFGRD